VILYRLFVRSYEAYTGKDFYRHLFWLWF